MARRSRTPPDEQLSLLGSEILANNLFEGSLISHLEQLPTFWQAALNQAECLQTIKQLDHWLAQEQEQQVAIYPKRPFRALELNSTTPIRVVILGQDPYHGPNQAQGLAFSVPDICPAPPSLRNIFTELALEYPDQPAPPSHDLSNWARQGVLLLNTSLTVADGLPGSHARKGWEQITDALISHLAAQADTPLVYLLWGAHAQAKTELITHHSRVAPLILSANHPSPLAARRPPVPFIGCGHFIQTNQWLQSHDLPSIDWFATGP
ncbi:uracil-DNA glycosylase [Alcaligenes endophyticus]|uniref:Uracil-DNA glycosylase n=1 Tax=Alcaligenes endophyticus TaxID=1929088 RepID=A0ABT8EEP3_9BURK|nr:uracil-DNA glycosylase [Alcaligenes endophyticus]MCX5592218.1 uracil-DNA glycosylase [Alcaligenes endophyticus]MDN4119660.1 uracil-DNA glycosylase [Alcaligenes endophyticus]